MPFKTLAFLAGIFWFQQLQTLPKLPHYGLLIAVGLWCLYRHYIVLSALIAGILWASLYATYYRAQQQLATEIIGPDVWVRGVIMTVPQVDERRVRFDFKLSETLVGVPGRLKLSWYKPMPTLRAGQIWRFQVKLKAPHGLINPGGFDYERWLFTEGIGATGYVRHAEQAELIGQERVWQNINVLRQSIAEQLSKQDSLMFIELLQALTIGYTDAIKPEQWQVLRNTGTLHLIAISGSHVSLLAGMSFWFVRRCWVLLGEQQIVAPHHVAACVAIATAVFYALLAGFEAPVQRAMWMLMVVMLGIIGQKHLTVQQIFILGLLGILAFDPLAVLVPGFWLSFATVALLYYLFNARVAKPGILVTSFKIHGLLALAILPLSLGFFQQISLVAPLANLIAVPIITLLIVPLALLGVLLLLLGFPLAPPLLCLVDRMLQTLWSVLELLAQWKYASFHGLSYPFYVLLLAGIGILILCMPKGLPGRYLGIFLGLPLFCYKPAVPAEGEVRFTLLDVGQGLSAVVQTQQHVLVYDTGIKFSEFNDSAQSVLLPFLAHEGITHLDAIVISHGDNDHSGGLATLLKTFKPETLYGSVSVNANTYPKQLCVQGQQWEWDNVVFTMLGPGKEVFEHANDNSCVLKVATPYFSILLTGDIELAAEQQLVNQAKATLTSNVLLAPHHGSNTSSSLEFLTYVKPELILIPAGFQNQYHFPHPAVIARYQAINTPWLNVAEQGAISIETNQTAFQLSSARNKYAKYWHN